MQPAGFDLRALERLRAALAERVDEGRLPGAVWCVGRAGAPATVESVGWQGPGRANAMAADAIFRIHSMTKPLVSVAALVLHEQGRLRLSDPVALHLPEFAAARVGVDGVAPARPMTVQDLLRHTAGLTSEFLPQNPVRERYVQAGLSARDRSNAEFSTLLAGLPLMHAPGTVWEYSRATDVLGRLIEVVGGQPLGAFLREAVFAPLGMVDTGFAVPAAQQYRLAQPFDLDPDSGAPVALFDPRETPRFESGGAGLLSTAADYARFLQCLLSGGTLDGQRLVGRKTVDWMSADHLGGLARDSTILPPGYGFGLGVAVRTAAGLATDPGSVGSYGWSGAAGTIFMVDPAEGFFALLMVQAPQQAAELWALFRALVYAAVE